MISQSLQKLTFIVTGAFLIASLAISTDAFSQNGSEPVFPPPANAPANTIEAPPPSFTKITDVTHPLFRLTPDRSEIIELNQDVDRIIIGNDEHLNILTDSPRRLIVVPRSPGTTFFSILNSDAEPIMQRHAIVASPKENYVRVRRTCSLTTESCEPTQVYYCPDRDMCHNMIVPEGASGGGAADMEGDADAAGTEAAAAAAQQSMP